MVALAATICIQIHKNNNGDDEYGDDRHSNIDIEEREKKKLFVLLSIPFYICTTQRDSHLFGSSVSSYGAVNFAVFFSIVVVFL